MYKRGRKNNKTVQIRIEGPYGSVGVDLQSPTKYTMAILLSGGIGVTPMQSICNQLMHEHNSRQRELKKLSFVWIERDPQVMPEVDVVRKESSRHFSNPIDLADDDHSFASALTHVAQTGNIATTLLAHVPASHITDEQFELMYPTEEFLDLDDDAGPPPPIPTRRPSDRRVRFADTKMGAPKSGRDVFHDSLRREDSQFLKQAYSQENGPMDLQVYLTSKNPPPGMPPFVHYGRPDIKGIFSKVRRDALQLGETRVAVCVCAPMRIVTLCRKACAKYSDAQVNFDFHSEVFE